MRPGHDVTLLDDVGIHMYGKVPMKVALST